MFSLIYFVSFRQSHEVEDKRKYWKVVKVKDVSRGKNLIDSRWVKLKCKTGIPVLHLTFSHVAVRLALAITVIPGFFAHDYDVSCAYYQRFCTCTETSRREKRFQDILSRLMSVLSCSTQFMTSSSCLELPTFFAKKCTLKLDLHSHRLMSVA